MNEQQAYTVVRISEHEFENWLLNGISRLTIAHRCSNGESTSEATLQDNGTWIFAVLPSKYATPLCSEHGVYALIDDVLQLSRADNEQTDELRARLHTLGETWLPVVFLPEVIVAQQQMPKDMPLAESISPTLPEHNSPPTQEPMQIMQAALDLSAEESTTKSANKRGRRAKTVTAEAQIPAETPSKSRSSGRKKRDGEPTNPMFGGTSTRSKKQSG